MKISSMGRQNKKRNKLVTAVTVGVLWLAVWQVVYWIVGQEVLVVSPASVFLRMGALAATWDFWKTASLSLLRVLAGFLGGTVLGVLLAVACASLPAVKAFFAPALHVIKATPVASFIILALVWLRRAQVPAFICVLMVLPIVWGNVMAGIGETDRSLLEMARVFRFSKMDVLRHVYLPSVFPYFTAGCTTGLGLAWKAGIAAEVLSTPGLAIGTRIYEAKVYLETVDLFAWTALVILLSVFFERVFVALLQKAGRKQMEGRADQ